MAGLLGEIFSQGDRAKRFIGGLLGDPIGTMAQTAGLLGDFRREDQALNSRAFADPANPLRVTDPSAMHQLGDRMLAGPLSMAPVGMIIKQGPVGNYVPVKVNFDPAEKSYSYTQDVNGQAILNANPVFRQDKDFLRARNFRAVDEYLWPFGDDVYFRTHHRKSDYDFLRSGTHKGSTNHATGEAEGGLSVARDLEHGNGYGYLVSGKRIGSGSDSEPLLDIGTVRLASDRMTRSQAWDFLEEARKRRAAELNISPEELRAFMSSRQLLFP